VAGYREFQTGEVLTAANVNNFLMNQSVMVFADATARTAALSDVLAEGMLTYNLDTAALEVYDGTAFVPAGAEPPAGIGSNVVSVVKTDTFSTTSTTFVDITGMTATLTPSSDTAKVLVIADIKISQTGNLEGCHVELQRGSTTVYVGDADGSTVQSSATAQTTGSDGGFVIYGNTIVVLDSPASDAATTYKLRLRVGTTGTAQFNRAGNNTADARAGRTASSITLIEVAV